MGELAAHAKGLVEAFNDADWDACRGRLGNGAYNELATQRALTDTDTILEAWRGWKTAMPDVRGTVTSEVESGQQVVLEITWEGTQTGEMVSEQGTIPPSGKFQRTPAVFVFEYEGGELKESRHYFDLLTYLRQIGAA